MAHFLRRLPIPALYTHAILMYMHHLRLSIFQFYTAVQELVYEFEQRAFHDSPETQRCYYNDTVNNVNHQKVTTSLAIANMFDKVTKHYLSYLVLYLAMRSQTMAHK